MPKRSFSPMSSYPMGEIVWEKRHHKLSLFPTGEGKKNARSLTQGGQKTKKK